MTDLLMLQTSGIIDVAALIACAIYLWRHNR
jgi:hypothetical protein